MSDAHEHEHHDDGAHEVDKLPNARLFNLLGGLSLLTLLACIGVVQLFNAQVDSIVADRGREAPFTLREYRDEEEKQLDGYGVITLKEGEVETTLYYIPVAKAKDEVLEDKNAFRRKGMYRGWETTDTFAAIREVESRARPPEPVPAGGTPTEGAPAGAPADAPKDEKQPTPDPAGH